MSHYHPDPYSNGSNPKPEESSPYRKPLGRYLVESGLLSHAQLDIALRDQEYSGYPLGEILVLRGWVKQSVIDLVIKKLQPRDESELQVVITSGQTVARGIVAHKGTTVILAEDDTELDFWDQETTVHQIKGEEENQAEA